MSSSNNSKKRNVHFPAGSITDEAPPQKRHRSGIDEENTEDRKPSALRPSTFTNNNKNNFNREDGDNEDPDGNDIPSKSELIEAKRKRRQIRGSGGALFNDDEDDHMDAAETSLATDGVKIEPFHMRDEENDGTGFFDGDTYVFRKHPPLEDGEPDAWADTLMREDDDKDGASLNIAVPKRQPHNNKSDLQEDLDELSKEQLYKRILILLGDAESIMQAIQRYGKLVKNPRKQRYGGKKNAIINKSAAVNDDKCNVAKKSLDELTGAANALLLKGEVDIYDTTKKTIYRMFPSSEQQTNNNKGIAKNNTDIITKWEYQGNEDNQLHGPYTTVQMLGWKNAGYFVGIQRVKIRTVQEEMSDEKESLSTEEDLLNDLMDDDDDDDDKEEEEESRPNKKAKNTNCVTVKGEWMWSNEVDYQKYL